MDLRNFLFDEKFSDFAVVRRFRETDAIAWNVGIYELSDYTSHYIKTKKTKIRRNDEAFTLRLPLSHAPARGTKIAIVVVFAAGKPYKSTAKRQKQSAFVTLSELHA